MEFKDKLKDLRKEHNLTQENLSNILHVSRSLVAKWENGLGLPSEDTIQDICDYFKISVDELFVKEDSINVIVDKNKKIKSRNLIIIMLVAVISFLVVLSSIDVIYDQIDNYKINKKAKELESLVKDEDIKIINLSVYDVTGERNLYDSSNGVMYVQDGVGLKIVVNMNDILYRNVSVSKVKLSCFEEYLSLYKSNGEFIVELYNLPYDCLTQISVEEFILKYEYNMVKNNNIITKDIEKSYLFDSYKGNWIDLHFVKDFDMNVDVSIFGNHLVSITSKMGESANDIINDQALRMLIDYRFNELADKYMLEFSDEFIYSFSKGTISDFRYNDYSIDVSSIISNYKISFSQDIYNLTLENGKSFEVEVFINNIKCDDYKVSIYDNTNKVAVVKNENSNLLFIANSSGLSNAELIIDFGFTKLVYVININIE